MVVKAVCTGWGLGVTAGMAVQLNYMEGENMCVSLSWGSIFHCLCD